MKKILFLCVFIPAAFISYAQEPKSEKKLIQFSGIVIHSDSLEPMPFVNVINVSRGHRGTYTDMKGFFSLVVAAGDTINISCLGYQRMELVIPKDLINDTFSGIFKLKPDVFNLPMVYIFPYATIEQFKQAFIKIKLPDDDLKIAQKNLDQRIMMALSSAMAWDGTQNTRYYFQQQSEKLYWAGQSRPNPLLDIVKLNQFMQLLNEGKISLKNEKREEEE